MSRGSGGVEPPRKAGDSRAGCTQWGDAPRGGCNNCLQGKISYNEFLAWVFNEVRIGLSSPVAADLPGPVLQRPIWFPDVGPTGPGATPCPSGRIGGLTYLLRGITNPLKGGIRGL